MPFRIPIDFLDFFWGGTGDWNWDAAHGFLKPLELQGRKSRDGGNSALCSLCHLKQKGPGSHSRHLTALHQRHTTQIPQSSSHLLFTKSTASRKYLTLNIPLHYYHRDIKTNIYSICSHTMTPAYKPSELLEITSPFLHRNIAQMGSLSFECE